LSKRQEKFTTYYNQYKNKVFSFFNYQLSGDRQLAEDLTGDTFVKALKNFTNYDSKKAFSTWIYTIARNVFIDHLRTQKPVESLDQNVDTLIDDVDLTKEVDQKIIRKQQGERIEKLLSRLSKTERECITLRYLGELSNKEIAKIVKRSEVGVRVAISRGLKRLRSFTILIIVIVINLFI
jgi:RNA polymerase sigma-70 factor (ECF subfamily)